MDILEKLQAQAEQVEVLNLQDESTKVVFEANRLKGSKVEETSGLAVRVIKDGRLGFAASSDEKAVEKLASNVLESAAFGEQIPMVFPGAAPAPEVIAYDQTIEELPVSHLVDMGKQVIDMLTDVEPEARVNVSIERSLKRIDLRNQTGAEITFQRSPMSIDLELLKIEGDDVLAFEDATGSTVWDEDYLAPVRLMCDKLVKSRRITSIRSGKMPVLFAPTGALALGLPLMVGVDGKNVYKGISPMAGKIGEKLFDESITVVDDGTLDGCFNSAPYDGEGIPHQRNLLIDRGVVKGYLYDLKTAAQSGLKSTGNGSRGLFNPPEPSPTSLILGAGDTSLKEIIAGMKEGLLVEDLLGLGQGNIISGAFSNPLSLAFKIEKGEIVGRVKNVSIAGNIYELLREVTAISKETRWVYRSFSLPYILLPEVNIVAKE